MKLRAVLIGSVLLVGCRQARQEAREQGTADAARLVERFVNWGRGPRAAPVREAVHSGYLPSPTTGAAPCTG